VENQRAENNYSPITSHDDSISVQGLDDLFKWASDTVSDGLDGRGRRVRDQQVRRQVLTIIHRSAEMQAEARHANEVAYLHRRVIALQGVLVERTADLSNLKQVVVAQYLSMQRIPELEEKVAHLEARGVKLEQAEEDRKHLMNALAKLKKDKDFLEELVTANESENARLAALLSESRQELAALKNRRWWHIFFPPQNK
jgi:hypothetical protein